MKSSARTCAFVLVILSCSMRLGDRCVFCPDDCRQRGPHVVDLYGIAAVHVGEENSELRIPRGSVAKIDGAIVPEEWRTAAKVQIQVRADWKVTVWSQHDERNLYFAFQGVKHGDQRVFPEVLVDPGQTRSSNWQQGQWWFHVSYNLCEGNGEHDVYRRDGVFQCGHTKPGWEGNNPPQQSTDTIEVRISFEKLGITYHPETKIGLALELTNATGDASQTWSFWPEKAELAHPSSWATGILK